MGYRNSQVRMNLDRMKTAMEECEATVTAMEAVIGDVRTTMTGLEDDYMGEDADTLQVQMKKYLDNQMKEICLNAGAMKQALTQGLENARYCKDYCQHFVDALGGGANGAVNDNKEIPGAMFCDYDAVAGLMDLCMDAERLAEGIRQSTHKIESVLDLEAVSFNVSAYTSAVRTECDRIDYLGMHRRNLENYASFVETTDTELAGALGGIYDTFMTPESVERRKLEYGSIDAKIEMMQEREKVLDEVQIKSLKGYMSKPIGSLTEEERRAIDEILNVLIENEAIAELELVIDYIGGGVGGVWTDGDAYVAAKILVYGENSHNTELLEEIYRKMIKEKLIEVKADIHTNTNRTIYTYEVSFDENAISNVLEELNPNENGMAYYSLQRRRYYQAKEKRVVYGAFPKEPGSNVSIIFNEVNGKLASIIEVGGVKAEIESVDMNESVDKKEIEKMLASGYTYEAIALGLTSNEIEMLERKGVHLTQTDIRNIGNTMYRDNAKLSSDYKAVIYRGSVYCIDVPSDTAVFEAIWNKDGTKKFSQAEFDLAAGILGIELEEIPSRTVIEEKKGGIHVLREREAYSNDKNVKGAAALSLLTGLTNFIENSLSSTNVEMVFESYGDNRRVRIYVGDSKTRMNMQNTNLNIPRNIYAINANNVLAQRGISNAIKALYQDLTGKEVPNPDGYYTMVANLNAERKNMIYSGYLSYSGENELLYTPYVFPDEEAHISECTFVYGHEKENIYDCTELLRRTTKVPKEVKEVMEGAWEAWGNE